MNPEQLKNLIITVLKAFGRYSEQAVDLLMLTAAQESHCGKFIRQIGGGPALGIFQMEPATLNDIMDNYVRYREKLAADIVLFLTRQSLEMNLAGNLLFQIVTARVHYMRVPDPIPVREAFRTQDDYVMALARYWKQHWNTELGAGTPMDAFLNYNRYIRS